MGRPYRLRSGWRIITVMTASRLLLSLLAAFFACMAFAQNAAPPIFQPEARPMPASVQVKDGLQLEYFFVSLEQGGVGLLRLSGAYIEGARAQFRQQDIAFLSSDGDALYALIMAGMKDHPRSYPLTVTAERESDAVVFNRELRIEPGGFIVQELKLPENRAGLMDPAIEENELALLQSLASSSQPTPLWDASGFELPHDSELTSPFGAFRLLDGGRSSRHTGWDQNLPIGAPVRAMAAGLVRFADPLDIRGNYALIDHGVGLFSGYAHFSELHVRAGQAVEAGQIIGLSGNTGRSSAPHLHWEILLNGEWVDGRAFLNLWLPAPSSPKRDANAR